MQLLYSLLTAALLCLTACGPKLELKGTVYVRPFTASADANDTPDLISQYLAETLVYSIHTQILDNFHYSANLKPGMPCPESDFELVGNLSSLGKYYQPSSQGVSSRNVSTGARSTITMDMAVLDCSGKQITHYTVMRRNANPLKLVEDVADAITEELGCYRVTK